MGESAAVPDRPSTAAAGTGEGPCPLGSHEHADQAGCTEHDLPVVREQMPGNADVDDVADVFSLLGDPGRVRILAGLLPGELCVADLAEISGQSTSAVSHALKLLRAHKVVASRRDGRRIFYRLRDPHVRMLLDIAFTHAAHSQLEHPEKEALP